MQYSQDSIYVTSIDIGVKHLGLCLSELNSDYSFKQVVWFELVDITKFVHLNEKAKKNCELYHKKLICDYLEHVFYLNHYLFEISFKILIERQPPGGITSVEQLIMYKFRDKVILISPVSMHSKFGWNMEDIDYEQRKVKSCQKALYFLTQNEHGKHLVEQFQQLERKHDIADAICLVIFWCRYKSRKLYIQKQLDELDSSDLKFDIVYLEQFRYIE